MYVSVEPSQPVQPAGTNTACSNNSYPPEWARAQTPRFGSGTQGEGKSLP